MKSKLMFVLIVFCCCALPAASNRNTGHRFPCPFAQQKQNQPVKNNAVAEDIDFLPMHTMMGHI